MKPKETIEKAYSGIPKNVGFVMDTSWIPTYRGIKYYWVLVLRKVKKLLTISNR
jgi:hypothetical protein